MSDGSRMDAMESFLIEGLMNAEKLFHLLCDVHDATCYVTGMDVTCFVTKIDATCFLIGTMQLVV